MQGLPKTIKLLNKNEHMKCRKVKAVLRYHTPNKRKEPELYFHHLLVLYYPWRDENNLIAADQTYTSKFYEAGVQKILEHNRSISSDITHQIKGLIRLRGFGGQVVSALAFHL